MLEGAGRAGSAAGNVLQHGLHAWAMRFLTGGRGCTIKCCLPVLPQTGVGVLKKLPSLKQSSVPFKSREASGIGGREGLYHGCTSRWAHTPATRTSHERRGAERTGRRAVVDRGQGVESSESSRHRLRLVKLTSDLPIVWQVIVAHLLLLVPAVVLLSHGPPVVTHLEKRQGENIFLVFCLQKHFFGNSMTHRMSCHCHLVPELSSTKTAWLWVEGMPLTLHMTNRMVVRWEREPRR